MLLHLLYFYQLINFNLSLLIVNIYYFDVNHYFIIKIIYSVIYLTINIFDQSQNVLFIPVFLFSNEKSNHTIKIEINSLILIFLNIICKS